MPSAAPQSARCRCPSTAQSCLQQCVRRSELQGAAAAPPAKNNPRYPHTDALCVGVWDCCQRCPLPTCDQVEPRRHHAAAGATQQLLHLLAQGGVCGRQGRALERGVYPAADVGGFKAHLPAVLQRWHQAARCDAAVPGRLAGEVDVHQPEGDALQQRQRGGSGSTSRSSGAGVLSVRLWLASGEISHTPLASTPASITFSNSAIQTRSA